MQWWLWTQRKPAHHPPTPSKHRFAFIRGRRIVADIPYLLPKDDEEIHRLDFQHFMFKAALGGLYAAPLQQPQAILDVATGTGRWAIEVACLFPRSTVTGFDLVPPPIDDATTGNYDPGIRPANYVFQQGDIFAGLPFANGSFDFVHMRLVYAATPIEKWLPLINELVRVTMPGGFVELVEGYVLLGAGLATTTIQNAAIALSKRRGIEITYRKTLGSMLAHCNMRDVKQREVHIPVGHQHGRLGTRAEKDTLSVFKALGSAAIANDILDAEEFTRLYTQMTRELAETLTIWPVYQAFGIKPLGTIRC